MVQWPRNSRLKYAAEVLAVKMRDVEWFSGMEVNNILFLLVVWTGRCGACNMQSMTRCLCGCVTVLAFMLLRSEHPGGVEVSKMEVVGELEDSRGKVGKMKVRE